MYYWVLVGVLVLAILRCLTSCIVLANTAQAELKARQALEKSALTFEDYSQAVGLFISEQNRRDGELANLAIGAGFAFVAHIALWWIG